MNGTITQKDIDTIVYNARLDKLIKPARN